MLAGRCRRRPAHTGSGFSRRRIGMTGQGSTLHSLTRAGLLAAAGFSVILLPFVSGRAQPQESPERSLARALTAQAETAATAQDLAAKQASLEAQKAEL